jgi:uncharacterized protein (TIGR03083 family)
MTSAAAPIGAIAALRASHDNLRSIVGSLTPEQIRERGYPAEWTVAQVLSHLGSGAEINTLTVDAGLAGAEPVARETFPPIWERWNGKSPDEQASDGIKADTVLVERIEANADSTATFTIWSGPTDINGLALSRLSEHAVHTWDIAVVLDPSATVLPAAVPLIMQMIARLVGFTAKPGPWTGVVKVTTTDPGHEYALTIGEQTSLSPWSADAPSPDAQLTLPAEAFLRLLYGRLDAAHAPAVTAEGISLDDLRAVFQGF